MAFVSSRSRERARRRKALILRIVRWGAALVAFVVIGYSSYQGGLALADLKVVSLRKDLEEVTRERDNARAARDNIQATLTRANEQNAALQTRYDADVPKGQLATVLQLARERIADGITPERIAEALRGVRAATPCEGRPTTKRFAVRPGAQPVPDDLVGFADGLITLFVSPGAEDSARSLTANFTRVGGAPVTATGPSPLRVTVPFDNAELRFTVANSDLRGFVTATMITCGR